jgi:hypothetical protein
MARYKVEQGMLPGVWYVHDNQTQTNVRTLQTRSKARWAVKAYNDGHGNEVEEENGTD